MATVLPIEQQLNPFTYYQTMRRSHSVYYDADRGSWSIFRYADVQRVLSEYATFSSQFMGDAPQSVDNPFGASMISTDPPRHRQLRSLVSQAFTPKAVDALAPRIQTIVNEHLDRVSKAGKMDLIHDLAIPLPVIVIAELMGIPPEDRGRFKQWSDTVVSLARNNPADMEMGFEGFDSTVFEMGAYFMNMLEERRKNPQDDLLSGLLQANIDGQTLSLPELIGFCALLLVAGNETTTNLLGNSILTFTEHPNDWRRLRQQPDLLPLAIEEVLRYRSPVQSMFRVTKNEAVVGDQKIPAGSHLIAWIGSANHDEAQFTEPEIFNLDRNPNRHLAFGYGIHFCLGAPLARLESRIALGAMLERFSEVRLDPSARLERMPSLIVYGVKALPIQFSA